MEMIRLVGRGNLCLAANYDEGNQLISRVDNMNNVAEINEQEKVRAHGLIH